MDFCNDWVIKIIKQLRLAHDAECLSQVQQAPDAGGQGSAAGAGRL